MENLSYLNLNKINGLEIYNTTSTLTNRFTDYVNLIVLPLISAYGVIVNFVSVLVSTKLKKDDIMNLFMIYKSSLNLIFSSICVFLCFSRCGSTCPYGYTYGAKFYELYIYLYICFSILLASQLLESIIAFNRLFAFSARIKHLSITPCFFQTLAPILIVLSFVLYACNVLVSRSIDKFAVLVDSNNNIVEYLYKLQENDLSEAVKLFLFVLNCFENLGLQIVLFVVDMIILVRLVMFIRHKAHSLIGAKEGKSDNSESNKKNIHNEHKELKLHKDHSRTNTLMILVISMFTLVGHVPNSISFVLFSFNLMDYKDYNYYLGFVNLLLFLSHSNYFFVFYFFNSKFKNEFLNLFKLANKL